MRRRPSRMPRPYARRAPGVRGSGGGGGEHGPAGAVEVAGADVEDVDQPRGHRAERRGGGADAGVDGSGRGAGQLVGHAADRVGVDAAGRRPPDPGVNGATAALELVEAVPRARPPCPGRPDPAAKSSCSMAASRWASVPGRIGTYSLASSAVLVRRGSTTTTRPPRSTDRSQAAGPVGGGGEAAVGGERVGAEDQQVVGAVDVGHRDGQDVAEHQRRGDLLGPLVDRGRREHVAACPAPAAAPGCRAARRGCGRWGCRRRRRALPRPCSAMTRPSPSATASPRLVPGGRLEPVAPPDQRLAEAVRVVVELAERGALRAQEPVAEHVELVAADAHHLAPSRTVDLEAAARLAQRAGRAARCRCRRRRSARCPGSAVVRILGGRHRGHRDMTGVTAAADTVPGHAPAAARRRPTWTRSTAYLGGRPARSRPTGPGLRSA